MPEGDLRLAYVGTDSYEDGKVYRSGALIVTLSGEPREFRCTSPVRPNQLQRITYGRSLEPHVYVEVMGKPLMRALQESVALYLVDDPVLLALREIAEQPVVYARRQGTATERAGNGTSQASSILIPSPSGDFDPVVVQALESDPDDVRVASTVLAEAAKQLDILEPFDRLKLALQKVHESHELDDK